MGLSMFPRSQARFSNSAGWLEVWLWGTSTMTAGWMWLSPTTKGPFTFFTTKPSRGSVGLVGHKSNRDGIGACIKITTASGSQWATVTTAGSYLSASDKRAHFGLGANEKASSVEIRWPSGIVQTLRNVGADQFLKVDEPAVEVSSGSDPK